MDNDELVVPQNSRIDHVTANELLAAQNSPAPPKSSPVSFASRLSSRSRNDGTPFKKFKQPCSTPVRSYEKEREVADILKSRLYDRAENSDVYRRQPRLKPCPPVGSSSNSQPNLYRSMLMRKDYVKIKLPPVGMQRTATTSSQKDGFQVDESETRMVKTTCSQPVAFHGPLSRKRSLGFGPDQFQGEDVLSVVKHLRAFLNWETDPEVIIYDADEEVNKEQSNYVKASQTVRKVLYSKEDSGQFAYATLKELEHRTARYNPYNLVCVSAAETHNLKQLYTVTASAVTHIMEHGEADLIPMARWLYERKMFYKIFEIPVFAKFRQWKAFTTWKNNVRFTVNSESRKTLWDTLFIVDDVLQLALLRVRRLCEEACSSLQHEPARVCFVDENFADTLTLQDFLDDFSRRADVVNGRLKALRTTCLAITLEACQNVISRHKGLLEWIRTERGPSAVKPSFTQIARWRGVVDKLAKFVRNVDFVVLELLRRLVTTAANTLLAKVQASSTKQDPLQHTDDERRSPRDDRCETGIPPAILTVKLILGIPESEASDEVISTSDRDMLEFLQDGRESTTSKSSADRTCSVLSQSDSAKAFVDINPDEEEFVTVIRRVISKFEEAVTCFKSLLTDSDVRLLVSPPDTDLVYSLTRHEEEEGFVALESWPNAELIFGEDPRYQDTITELITIVRKGIDHVRDFSKTCDGVTLL